MGILLFARCNIFGIAVIVLKSDFCEDPVLFP